LFNNNFISAIAVFFYYINNFFINFICCLSWLTFIPIMISNNYMKFWQNGLIGLAAALAFSLCYAAGLFAPAEERIYDIFLRFRADRERLKEVVFLDVDDPAIAYNGVFPWPRSVTADGLLRLKEYGARAAVFDIEFIDKSPPGVDAVYLNDDMPRDFNRSFAEINSAMTDVFSALYAGRISRSDIGNYAGDLSSIISGERDSLFARTRRVARDNDLYLAQASALFGGSWVSLNLREETLTGEQAERRPMAEERFSYPVRAAPDAHTGNYLDILPPLPVFALSGQGAGYTNVEVDDDGIRRRIFLAQRIWDHWYLQLAFSPLIHYLGMPEIELEKEKLIIRQARFPDGITKDISIPLDSGGRMMLNWPRENYFESYSHISFADFSLLESLEREMKEYSLALESLDLSFFARYDPALSRIIYITSQLAELFDAIPVIRDTALEQCSEESFDTYTEYRAMSRALIREIIDLDPAMKLNVLLPDLCAAFPESEGAIRGEAEDFALLVDYLKKDLDRYDEVSGRAEQKVRDKFCVLGRVDTATTDIGVNPFYGRYVNVGTHAVVLDTILSESFIIPLKWWWSAILCLLFVPLLFLVTAKMAPLPRMVSGFASAALLLAAGILLFRLTGVYFGILGTLLAIVIAVIAREIISYAGSEREKRFYRKAFATYTSEAVADQIAANPSLLQLGGTKRRMSAIFTDIRGFSTISEKLGPEELVTLLNRYLTVMSDVVLDNEGTIDKYEGDAIIAFFGAPLEQKDHALRACFSAVRMKRLEAELNKAVMEDRITPAPLLTRIGINSGDMVAGNMGTDKKMNYTIMGDAVNLAARLEGVNKQYGTWILASEDTVNETGGRLLTRRLDRVRVVGKSEPVRLYELVDIRDEASGESRKLVEVFHQALDCFEARDWKQAAEGFRETLSAQSGDGPSKKYLDRCEAFFKEPPADNWDGVYNLTEK
jgi:adenylate cyclase